jgi:hypothetical protein
MPDFIVFKAGKASPPPYQGGVRGGRKDLCVHGSYGLGGVEAKIPQEIKRLLHLPLVLDSKKSL